MRIITADQRKAIGKFFDDMRNAAQENFERDGCCVPVALLLRDEGPAAVPLQPFLSDKDLASAVLNQAIEATHPLAFVLVTEAWLASKEDHPDADLLEKFQGQLATPAPGGGQQPKAGVRESVILICSAVTGENFLLTAEIVRSEGSKPSLKPWARQDTAGAKGRFLFDVTPLAERQ